MTKKGRSKKNATGYDHIPVNQGKFYDYADSSYLQDKDFMKWYTESNLPVGGMWVAWAAWKEKEKQYETGR